VRVGKDKNVCIREGEDQLDGIDVKRDNVNDPLPKGSALRSEEASGWCTGFVRCSGLLLSKKDPNAQVQMRRGSHEKSYYY